jgi:hypothetical protein
MRTAMLLRGLAVEDKAWEATGNEELAEVNWGRSSLARRREEGMNWKSVKARERRTERRILDI